MKLITIFLTILISLQLNNEAIAQKMKFSNSTVEYSVGGSYTTRDKAYDIFKYMGMGFYTSTKNNRAYGLEIGFNFNEPALDNVLKEDSVKEKSILFSKIFSITLGLYQKLLAIKSFSTYGKIGVGYAYLGEVTIDYLLFGTFAHEDGNIYFKPTVNIAGGFEYQIKNGVSIFAEVSVWKINTNLISTTMLPIRIGVALRN